MRSDHQDARTLRRLFSNSVVGILSGVLFVCAYINPSHVVASTNTKHTPTSSPISTKEPTATHPSSPTPTIAPSPTPQPTSTSTPLSIAMVPTRGMPPTIVPVPTPLPSPSSPPAPPPARIVQTTTIAPTATTTPVLATTPAKVPTRTATVRPTVAPTPATATPTASLASAASPTATDIPSPTAVQVQPFASQGAVSTQATVANSTEASTISTPPSVTYRLTNTKVDNGNASDRTTEVATPTAAPTTETADNPGSCAADAPAPSTPALSAAAYCPSKSGEVDAVVSGKTEGPIVSVLTLTPTASTRSAREAVDVPIRAANAVGSTIARLVRPGTDNGAQQIVTSDSSGISPPIAAQSHTGRRRSLLPLSAFLILSSIVTTFASVIFRQRAVRLVGNEARTLGDARFPDLPWGFAVAAAEETSAESANYATWDLSTPPYR